VQDEVEKALRRLHWQGKHVLAAGRTDSGVHALGQVIAFDLEWKHSAQDLRQALNALLPFDIAAKAVQPVHPRFDPRRHALSRCYEYRLFLQDVRDPLRERFAWRVWPSVDREALHRSAAMMVGEHDFCAFGSPPRIGGSTLRTVRRSCWRTQESGWVYEVESEAFLYHMVRRMVAIQVAIGQGRSTLADLERALHPQGADSAPEQVQGLAPPQGLYLVGVNYPPGVLAP
jgi:tRNA pseudouridine38-40 synthase